MHILGIVILAVGVVLLLMGFNASRAITERILSGLTGHFTQNTRLFLYGGILLIIAGAVLLYMAANGGTWPIGPSLGPQDQLR